MTDEQTPEARKRTFSFSKKWNQYFFDFLMLFLAVFFGFVAENVRENYSEHEQGMNYVQSFYEDLKTDTATAGGIIRSQNKRIEVLTAISLCYDSVSKGSPSNSCLLDLMQNSLTFLPFKINNRTINQLENGGYRLLPKNDADSIINYVNAFTVFQSFQSTILQGSQNNVRNTNSSILNFEAKVFKIPFDVQFKNSFNKKVSAPLLFSNDKTLLNRYFNELMLYTVVTIEYQNRLKVFKEKEVRIINYLNNKYHFDK